MDDIIITSFLAFLGVIISVILSFVISKSQNKIELKKMHSEFIGQLYSKRLEAYLEIYKLISGYIKIIKRKGVNYENLLNFYENYSELDSKSSLLFSYTTFYSDQLMRKIDEIINYSKTDVISNDQKNDLIEKLRYIETTMRLELGVYIYKDPATIIKNYEIPERKKDMVNKIMRNYSKGYE